MSAETQRYTISVAETKNERKCDYVQDEIKSRYGQNTAAAIIRGSAESKWEQVSAPANIDDKEEQLLVISDSNVARSVPKSLLINTVLGEKIDRKQEDKADDDNHQLSRLELSSIQSTSFARSQFNSGQTTSIVRSEYSSGNILSKAILKTRNSERSDHGGEVRILMESPSGISTPMLKTLQSFDMARNKFRRDLNSRNDLKMRGYSDKVVDDVENLIRNPISCGFFLKYCESQYSAENIYFILEIDHFRDLLLSDPNAGAWVIPWRNLDKLYIDTRTGVQAEDPTWPLEKIAAESVQQMIIRIINNFLSSDSLQEICVNVQILERTLIRARHFKAYGPDIFEEAYVDPVKTVSKDILPRFLKSPLHEKMQQVLEYLIFLPVCSDLVVEAPGDQILLKESILQFPMNRKYVLSDSLKYSVIYDLFYNFLDSKSASKNLLCLRLHEIFQACFSDKVDVNRAEQLSIEIFKYFVSNDSPLYIHLNSSEQRNIMYLLASPQVNMFDCLVQHATARLLDEFDAFSLTPNYFSIGQLMRDRKKCLDRDIRSHEDHATSCTKFSCLGL